MKHSLRAVLLPLCLLATIALTAQEFGLASYYSDRYQGRRTAYGDTYDKNELTASHKKHPYGTLLKVTRLDNKKSVVVKVIDKGPYTKGRIVDLSRAAAERLDLIDDGVAEVKVEVYKRGGQETATRTPPPTRTSPPPAPRTQTTTTTRPPQVASAAAEADPPKPEPTPQEREPQPTTPTTTTTPDRSNLVGQDYSKYGLYKIRLERAPTDGFGVQVSVITNYANVLKAIADLQAQHFDGRLLISVEPGQQDQPLYKIILGPFESEAQAQNYQSNLKERYNINGFVVNFAEKVYVNTPETGNN